MKWKLQCRRCRWVGTQTELRSVPQANDRSISDNVCPRCGCKTCDAVKKEPNRA
jgi:hypothetical protein